MGFGFDNDTNLWDSQAPGIKEHKIVFRWHPFRTVLQSFADYQTFPYNVFVRSKQYFGLLFSSL